MARSDRRPGARTRSGPVKGRTGARSHRRTGTPADTRPSGRADDGPRVLVSREGGVATLVLNRPGKRNALDRQAIAELHAALTACDLAADVRVVVLRGAGTDFCAGMDLAEALASVGASPEENARRAMEL